MEHAVRDRTESGNRDHAKNLRLSLPGRAAEDARKEQSRDDSLLMGHHAHYGQVPHPHLMYYLPHQAYPRYPHHPYMYYPIPTGYPVGAASASQSPIYYDGSLYSRSGNNPAHAQQHYGTSTGAGSSLTPKSVATDIAALDKKKTIHARSRADKASMVKSADDLGNSTDETASSSSMSSSSSREVGSVSSKSLRPSLVSSIVEEAHAADRGGGRPFHVNVRSNDTGRSNHGSVPSRAVPDDSSRHRRTASLPSVPEVMEQMSVEAASSRRHIASHTRRQSDATIEILARAAAQDVDPKGRNLSDFSSRPESPAPVSSLSRRRSHRRSTSATSDSGTLKLSPPSGPQRGRSLSPLPPQLPQTAARTRGASVASPDTVGQGFTPKGRERGPQQSPIHDLRTAVPRQTETQSHISLTERQLQVRLINQQATDKFRSGAFDEALALYRQASMPVRRDFRRAARSQSFSFSLEGRRTVTKTAFSGGHVEDFNDIQASRHRLVDGILLINTLNSVALTTWRLHDLDASTKALEEASEVSVSCSRLLDELNNSKLLPTRIEVNSSTPTSSSVRPEGMVRSVSMASLIGAVSPLSPATTSSRTQAPQSTSQYHVALSMAIIHTTVNRGVVAFLRGDYGGAEALFTSALNGERELLATTPDTSDNDSTQVPDSENVNAGSGLHVPRVEVEKLVGQTLGYIGMCRAKAGVINGSLEQLQEALKRKMAKEPAVVFETTAEERKRQQNGTSAVSLLQTAHVHASMGSFPKALESYSEALRLQRQVESSSAKGSGASVDVATTLHHLGRLYAANGKYVEALQTYQQAFDHYRNVAGFDEGHVLVTSIVRDMTQVNVVLWTALQERQNQVVATGHVSSG